MKYNLTDIPRLFKNHPELQNTYLEAVNLHLVSGEKVVTFGMNMQELMAFIIYAYHPKSPIATELSIHKRRQQALANIGYAIVTDKDITDKPEIAALIVGRNQFVNRLALHFCKGESENSIDWIEMCRLSDIIDDTFLALKEEPPVAMSGKPMTATELLIKKAALEKACEPIRDKIKSIAHIIFANDDSLLNLAASHIILEKRKPIITPEDFANAYEKYNGDYSKMFGLGELSNGKN